MKKTRYFTISRKTTYGLGDVMIRTKDMNKAIEAFKFFNNKEDTELERVSVPDNTKKPDKEGWVPDETLYTEKKSSEYVLGSEFVDIYSSKEIEKIKKEREDWLKKVKKKGKNVSS